MTDVFDLDDREIDSQIREVRETLVHTLVCQGRDSLVEMMALADLLGLMIAIKTMDRKASRPVILEGFITALENAVERHGTVEFDRWAGLH